MTNASTGDEVFVTGSLPHHSSLITRYCFLLLLLLLGAGVRIHALGEAGRFHPDEALFSTFARRAALNGDWLLRGSLDKPPLAIYANGLSMALIAAREAGGVLNFDARTGEFAARLPGMFASITLIAVVYALAHRLYRDRVLAAWAALLTAFSPFAIAFSATAFTDGLMLLFMALALLSAARARWWSAGLWLGLAFATKQQALYYAPLVLAIGWAVDRLSLRRIAAVMLPVAASFALITGWDAARGQATSLWALADANNNPARLIRANEVSPRLSIWFERGRFLIGSPTILFVAAALLATGVRIVREPRRRSTLVDVILLTYALAYLLTHWLIAFNTYDRYLLPLLPVMAILGARGAIWLWRLIGRRLPPQEMIVIAAAFALVLALNGWNASAGQVNVGGDGGNGARGVYEGIDALADFLNAQSPGAIIYDRWLGWQLGYYLGEWTDKRLVHYPTPEALAAGALAQHDPAPRYFPVPVDEPVAVWLDALRGSGFTVDQVYATARFAVYRLVPPASALQHFLNNVQQVMGNVRLRQVAVSPLVQGDAYLIRVDDRRENEDRQRVVGRVAAQLPQKVHSADFRHH